LYFHRCMYLDGRPAAEIDQRLKDPKDQSAEHQCWLCSDRVRAP
jgi:hypothetical protein